jgi:hypothetical protein
VDGRGRRRVCDARGATNALDCGAHRRHKCAALHSHDVARWRTRQGVGSSQPAGCKCLHSEVPFHLRRACGGLAALRSSAA